MRPSRDAFVVSCVGLAMTANSTHAAAKAGTSSRISFQRGIHEAQRARWLTLLDTGEDTNGFVASASWSAVGMDRL
jgi:hypothetical protein